MELFAKESILHSLAGKISLFLGGPLVAPVFLTIMGFFLAASKRKLTGKLKRGAQLILLGLILNVLLNFHLLIRIYLGDFDLNPWHYVFGADLLSCAGLSVIVIALMSRIFKEKYLLYLAAALLLAAMGFIPLPDSAETGTEVYIQAYFWSNAYWSFFPLIPWLSYPLAGYAFYLFQIKEKHMISMVSDYRLHVLVFSLIILILTSFYGVRISTRLEKYYHHDLLFFLWTLLLMFTWMIFFQKVTEKLNLSGISKYIILLGKHVTVAYIVQWVIIGNVATAVFRTQNLLSLAFWYVLVMSVTLLAVLLAERRSLRAGYR
jgi:hypothetical protein